MKCEYVDDCPTRKTILKYREILKDTTEINEKYARVLRMSVNSLVQPGTSIIMELTDGICYPEIADPVHESCPTYIRLKGPGV
jgi:hypothetical protein